MPKNLEALTSDSFADFLVSETARISKIHIHPHADPAVIELSQLRLGSLRSVATQLPVIKRHSFDYNIAHTASKLDPIPLDEVIGSLKHVSFPFDKFWIEGPCIDGFLMGALITADQANHSYSLLPFMRYAGVLNMAAPIMAITAELTVSADLGVVYNEEKMYRHMELMEKFSDFEGAGNFLDLAYGMADFTARLFAVIGSDRVKSNLTKEKTPEDLELEAKNRRRLKLGRPPLLPADPLRIDITEAAQIILESGNTEKIKRELLGWTSVRRSREIRRRDGTLWISQKTGLPFTRGPHDRQIPSAVDRRNAKREMFSGDPSVSVEIVDGRPTQVRKKPSVQSEPSQ